MGSHETALPSTVELKESGGNPQPIGRYAVFGVATAGAVLITIIALITSTLFPMFASLLSDRSSSIPTAASMMTSDRSLEFIPAHVGTITDGIERPMAVAVSEQGTLYVADGGCRCIRVYGDTLDLLATIGPEIGDGLTLQYPVGLTLDDEGALYVSDLATGAVFKIERLGEDDWWVSRTFADASGLRAPVGLALVRGVLYVTDVERHQILAIDEVEGSLVKVIGKGFGSAPGQMMYPNDVIALTNSRLLVADSSNNRVQVFDDTGRLLEVWTGPLILPRGMAVDEERNIHIASLLNREIVVYNANGRYVGSYQGLTNGPNDIEFPIAVGIRNGHLYIADQAMRQIQIGELHLEEDGL